MAQVFERLARHRRQLLEFPDDGRAYVNLANALRLSDQLSEGLSWARWSLRQELWPEAAVAPTAFQGLGNLLLDLGCFEEANHAYTLADPDHSNARIQYNRSRVMQGLGHWQEAWTLAESRWMNGGEALKGSPPRPHWSGWPSTDQLLLWDEQGFGDTLQALRWLPGLMQKGFQLQLQVRPPLQRLLEQGLAWLQPGLTVSERRLAKGGSVQGGCHGSLLSLPVLLKADEMALALSCACQRSRRRCRHSPGLAWSGKRGVISMIQARPWSTAAKRS